MYGSNWRKYVEQDMMTSHPIKNTITIYEKCIAKFRLVEKLYGQFKYKDADEQLGILESVFEELKLSVNEKADEELARFLYQQYNWILSEINDMKMFRDTLHVKDIEYVLNNLIEGYKGAILNESK